MSTKSSSTSGGISFLGLLGIVFITLKLIGKINWSWWWVTCPLWCPLAVAIAIFMVVGIFMLIAFIVACICK